MVTKVQYERLALELKQAQAQIDSLTEQLRSKDKCLDVLQLAFGQLSTRAVETSAEAAQETDGTAFTEMQAELKTAEENTMNESDRNELLEAFNEIYGDTGLFLGSKQLGGLE